MNKLQRFNKKILISTVALVLAATAFIASVCYAWFVIGLNSKTNDTYTQVVGEGLAFGSTITAVKHYTAVTTTETDDEGKIVETYNYYVSSGQIKPSSTSDESDGNSPFFGKLMPGDYVDITFSVYAIDDDLSDKNFKIYLTDFATDSCKSGTANSSRSYSFQLKDSSDSFFGSVYGVLGVFKWGIVETTTDSTTGEETESVDLKYFHEEYKTENKKNNVFGYYEDGYDDGNYTLTIASGKFKDTGTDNQIEFTLRIKVDTEDFESLISEKDAKKYETDDGEYYLSNITLSIGRIVLSKTDSDS